MSFSIYLYDEKGNLLPDSFNLGELITKAMVSLLKINLNNMRIYMKIIPVKVLPKLQSISQELPSIVNLEPQYGYIEITITDKKTIIYRHVHSFEEIIALSLDSSLQDKNVKEKIIGFSFTKQIRHLSSFFEPSQSIAYPVSNRSVLSNMKPLFRIQRLKEDPLPLVSFDDFKIIKEVPYDYDRRDFVKIMIFENAYMNLMSYTFYSNKYEEGGFLLGHSFRDTLAKDTYFLLLTDIKKAEYTHSSMVHLVYTPETFSRINQVIREERPKKQLLGWYHTHLFPATDDFGLSTIDLNLHFTTFKKPWQIAGLINIAHNNHLVLRFYVRKNDKMIQSPFWIIDNFQSQELNL